MLLHYYRCSISFLVSDEKYGGKLTSNGSWTGILKFVDQNKVDFIPHMFSFDDNRNQLLDDKQLFPQEHSITILSQKNYIIDYDPFKLFHAYTLDIWLLILISFISFTFIINLFECLMTINYENNHNHWFRFYHLVNNLIDIFTLFMGQDLTKWKNSVRIHYDDDDDYHHQCLRQNSKTAIKSLRYSLIIWIFASVILRLLFSLDILALFLSEKEQNIDYFDQLESLLQKHPNFRIIMDPKSSTGQKYLQNFPKSKKFIIPVENRDLTTWRTIEKLSNGHHILIIDRRRAELLENFYENLKLHVSIEGLRRTLVNLAIRKSLDNQTKHYLRRISKNIHEMGIWKVMWLKLIKFNRLQSELNILQNQGNLTLKSAEDNAKKISEIKFKNKIFIENNMTERSLDATNTLSLIYVYLLSIGFSITMFIIEILYFIIKINREATDLR
uniref:Uncharacterized protein LOC113790362 n=1 Tax=Dermatophagoides pteronyssinus TaxID=6956 RepID=A0A6P6XSL7_DERPT|nr:uncharacterized protein LOC113790362 [Dermatophagoides pteronyssinus]